MAGRPMAATPGRDDHVGRVSLDPKYALIVSDDRRDPTADLAGVDRRTAEYPRRSQDCQQRLAATAR